MRRCGGYPAGADPVRAHRKVASGVRTTKSDPHRCARTGAEVPTSASKSIGVVPLGGDIPTKKHTETGVNHR